MSIYFKLRKNKVFQFLIKKFDLTISFKFYQQKVYCKLLRDLSVIVNKEKKETDVFYEFERIINEFKPTSFFDIGANLGLFSWYLSIKNPKIKLFLFEPDKTNIDLLKLTLSKNNIENFELFEGVVSEDSTHKEFLIDPVSGATGSLINDSDNIYSLHHSYNLNITDLVNSTTLDSYVDSIDAGRCIVKIDVEGAENLVLAGGMKFINQIRPHIFIETFNKDVLSPIEELDYRIEKLDDRFNYLLSPK